MKKSKFQMIQQRLVRSDFRINKSFKQKKGERIEITVPPDQFNYAVGYGAANKIKLAKNFPIVKFITDTHLKDRQIKVKIYSTTHA